MKNIKERKKFNQMALTLLKDIFVWRYMYSMSIKQKLGCHLIVIILKTVLMIFKLLIEMNDNWALNSKKNYLNLMNVYF